jgi:DNA-binding transcriptional regulator YiaG
METTTPETPFSLRIRAERKRVGMTQSECAALLSVSKRALESWEDGSALPLAVAQEGALARLRTKQ